ncbi:DUF1631 family protein [Noviherbaspirillum saxi]|uniref:DUF1631 family protein n=1 Tax=Noviherbaspirillum saxi TaxID=2320863 RepID=A0A3A3FIQ6_9BURK|nr:DUF1631 family protein [Noviherbaspirillum saxi]RJF95134.1 DUF1631 family protein [Noviherbaspirillum saxi]
MNDPTSSRANPMHAVPANRVALLHALAFAALRLSVAQLDEFSVRLSNALAAHTSVLEGNAAIACRHAAVNLDAHRATFHKFVAECLQESLLQAAQSTADHGMAPVASGAMDLSLLNFEAMESRVLLDNLSQALDAFHRDSLTALSLRIASWLDSDAIGIAQNPFRSEIFLCGVSAAWLKFDHGGEAHRIVMQQMRPEVFLSLDTIWQELNDELVSRGVLPDLETTYRKRIVDIDMATPSIDVRLRAWLAPEGVLNIIDARVTALMERMCVHLLRNEAIPERVRKLLFRMRDPLTRLALVDTAFILNENHAVRRLLQEIMDAGLGDDATAAPGHLLYRMLESIVTRTETAVAALAGTAIPEQSTFEALGKELKATVEQFHRRVQPKLAAQCEQAVREEEQSHAHALARADVFERIENGEVPAFLEDFLLGQWTRVLAFGHGARNTKPDVLPMVLNVMDELVWSVQPKSELDARKDLVSRLPNMLAMLNAWLNVIKWNGPERDAFFTDLAERHAGTMRAPIASSPRQKLELRMNTVQKASEHQLTRRAREQQQAALVGFTPLLDRLGPKSWMEFVRNNGTRVNCRLLWISPQRGRFIFVVPATEVLFTLSDEALAQALHANRANAIASNTLIGRAFDDALQDLGIK